jgi:hypothetical protein
MKTLFSVSAPAFGLFNASHDEALEAGTASYNPSSAARLIERDLSMLLYWDRSLRGVLVERPEACRELIRSSSLLERPCELVSSLTPDLSLPLRPWGVDHYLLRRLARAGYKPTPEDYRRADQLREWQHRSFSSALLPSLLDALRSCPALGRLTFTGESVFARTMGDVESALRRFDGRMIMKRPLSGSGRGLRRITGELTRQERQWITATIRHQGGLECQRLYDRAYDFAMEFMADAPGVFRLTGYSEFTTSSGGAYSGNFLSDGSQEGREIYDALGATPEEKAAFEEVMLSSLSAALPAYTGPLGIDMMVCQGDSLAVFPLVEMNFRRTMGMVANSLGIRPDAGSTGRFCVVYIRDMEEYKGQIAKFCKKHFMAKSASFIGDERYLQGFVPLTPLMEDSRFHAYIAFERQV